MVDEYGYSLPYKKWQVPTAPLRLEPGPPGPSSRAPAPAGFFGFRKFGLRKKIRDQMYDQMVNHH